MILLFTFYDHIISKNLNLQQICILLTGYIQGRLEITKRVDKDLKNLKL